MDPPLVSSFGACDWATVSLGGQRWAPISTNHSADARHGQNDTNVTPGARANGVRPFTGSRPTASGSAQQIFG